MLTACPECRTRFRVGQAQLDAKRGLVRCGHCNAVFNAYDSLLPELETPSHGKPAPAVPPAPAELPRSAPSAPQFEAVELAPEFEPVELAPEQRLNEAIAAYLDTAVDDAQGPVWAEETPDSILLSDLPVRERRPFPWRGLGLGLLLLILALALPLQVAFFLRGELAARLPETRPMFEAVCAELGCVVPLPRDREALRVEASSLEADPENPATVRLRVAFSNRAEQLMAWPHLQLTLTDVRDQPVAQRAFAPGDYLDAKSQGKPGITPGQEHEVRLSLSLSGLAAAGYRVSLEYP